MGIKQVLTDFFGSWTVPASVTIKDLRLGILFWILRLGVAVYIIASLLLGGAYLYKEEPAGYPTFYFESGGLLAAQNGTKAYCGNPDYDYMFSAQEDTYWNQKDIECYNLNYGDILRKDVKSGFITTMFKRLHTKVAPCASNVDPCGMLGGSPGDRVVRNTVASACQCSKQQDYFVLGVEKMMMSLEHTFSTSSIFHESKDGKTVHGSSVYTSSSEHEKKLVKTCVKRAGMDEDSCEDEFEPGETITYSIEKWLQLAGISLDGRLESSVAADVRSGAYPQRRSTGGKLHVYMKYSGNENDNVIKCDITVSAVEGWNSIGSVNTYLDRQSQNQQEYYDDYKLGLSMEFFPTGLLWRFDWTKTFQYLIAGLVMLGIVDTVVGVVAFKLLPEKSVYKHAQMSELQYSKALARFSVTTALACHAFKQWDQDGRKTRGGEEAGDGPKELSRSELAKVFAEGFPEETASQFASTLIAEAGKGESLKCADLVELMSDGLVSVKRLEEHARQNCAPRMVQVTPVVEEF